MPTNRPHSAWWRYQLGCWFNVAMGASPSLPAAANLEIPTEQQMSVASNWPRKPFVQVQKYPDLVLNALTLYNCHGVGGTEKKEGTPNTQSTWFSLTNWNCSILKQKLHLDKEETHSLIHFTSCSDFELDINLRLMMDQRILDFPFLGSHDGCKFQIIDLKPFNLLHCQNLGNLWRGFFTNKCCSSGDSPRFFNWPLPSHG